MYNNIKHYVNDYLKKGNKFAVTVLRGLLSDIQLEAINTKTEITNILVIKVLHKNIKQRKESIEAFKSRPDLVEKETKELKLLELFLPIQLTEKEVEQIVDHAISLLEAKTIKDMGKVMKHVIEVVNGRSDNKTISNIIKSKLG